MDARIFQGPHNLCFQRGVGKNFPRSPSPKEPLIRLIGVLVCKNFLYKSAAVWFSIACIAVMVLQLPLHVELSYKAKQGLLSKAQAESEKAPNRLDLNQSPENF